MEFKSSKKPKIIFTGGGSAGHVVPNLALIEKFQQERWDIAYIGSKNGIERQIIGNTVPYYAIETGKLRRQLDWRNLLTPFLVLTGIFQAIKLCHQLKPSVIFSKGGFVAFPVVFAGWLLRIPVLAHESDLTPGLANRLSLPFADYICLTFPETANYLPKKARTLLTGTPIRAGFFQGSAERGRALCGFNTNKKIILVYGGGLGAQKINQTIRVSLPALLTNFQIVHACGKGKTDPEFAHIPGYVQFEYLNDELFDMMAMADLVISRAGANSVYELLALKKPNILIPLSKQASRGDQLDNAAWMEKQGLSKVIFEEKLTSDLLQRTIYELINNQSTLIEAAAKITLPNTIEIVYQKAVEVT